MTVSNSKLTPEQKDTRKRWLNDLEYFNGEIATAGYFTVAKIPLFNGSRMANFSVSKRSLDEQKFRRKVGEYHALRKLLAYPNENILLPNEFSAMDFAQMLNSEYEDRVFGFEF